MSENNANFQGGINIGMSGAYRLQVVDSFTKEIVKDYGWNKNLILNSGMNMIAGTSISNVSAFGCIGTGSRPNFITSSTSTITQSGQYIYLVDTSSIPSFTSSYSTYSSIVNGADIIVDQNNSQSNVLKVISGSILYVDSNINYDAGASQSFTIWKTSQTGLEKEIHRSNTYFPGSSSGAWYCGTQISASTTVMRRTYDFAVEAATKSYSEVGVAWTGTPNGGLFSRTLLPVTATLSPGQQLRMTYDLSVNYTPITPVYRTASIVGWPVLPSTTTTGTESIQSFIASTVDTNGNNSSNGSYGSRALDPSSWNAAYSPGADYEFCVWASTDATPLVTGSAIVPGGAIGRSGDWAGGSVFSYTPATGSYQLYKTGTLTIYQAGSAAIRSIGFGASININGYEWYVNANDPQGQAMAFLFDQPQTKTNLQTLTLTWVWNWSRVIQ